MRKGILPVGEKGLEGNSGKFGQSTGVNGIFLRKTMGQPEIENLSSLGGDCYS